MRSDRLGSRAVITVTLAFLNVTWITIPIAEAQAPFQFAPPTNFSIGFLDYATVADLNGDEKSDVIVSGSGQVGYLLGDGEGGLGAVQGLPGGFIITSTAAGSARGDGCRDVVVLDSSTRELHVYVVTNCSYEARTTHGVPDGTLSVATADFNEDGKDDYVITSFSGGSVTVFLGDGAGGLLAAAMSWPLSGEPYFVQAADLDQDGHADFAVVCRTSGRVAFFYGVGDGTFTRPSFRKISKDGRFLAVGDVNNDGLLDVATASFDWRRISILTQTKPRRFKARKYDGGSGPIAVAIGDLNCDGLPDVVSANYYDGAVAILAGTPTGKFVPAGSLLVGGAPYCVRVADFDSDGILDVLTANYNPGHSLTLMLNRCGSSAR